MIVVPDVGEDKTVGIFMSVGSNGALMRKVALVSSAIGNSE